METRCRLGLGVAFLFFACSSNSSKEFEQVDGGNAGSAGSSAGSAGSNGGDAGSSAGGSSSGSGGSATAGSGGGTEPCPSEHGPSMVRVTTSAASFCIDSTEVSRAMYAEFLQGLDQLAPQPEYCNWNASFEPQGDNTTNEPELPVVGVDFCDARAYCEWAGKRLCGKIGGGATDFDAYDDSSESQWFAACTAGGTRFFPYGNEYDGTLCNGADYGAGALIPVATSDCEGGYDGIFDMSGNAWEWENACDGTAGITDQCRLRSGEFSNPEGFLRCDYGGFSIGRDFVSNTIGIRCCGP